MTDDVLECSHGISWWADCLRCGRIIVQPAAAPSTPAPPDSELCPKCHDYYHDNPVFGAHSTCGHNKPAESVTAARPDEPPDEDDADEQVMAERDRAQDALQEAHVALGGDGEWVAKLPPEAPPHSGDLHLDVPALCRDTAAALAQREAEIARLNTRCADLERVPENIIPLAKLQGVLIAMRERGGQREYCVENHRAESAEARVSVLSEALRHAADRLLAISTDAVQDCFEDPVGYNERDAAGWRRISKTSVERIESVLTDAEAALAAAPPPPPAQKGTNDGQ